MEVIGFLDHVRERTFYGKSKYSGCPHGTIHKSTKWVYTTTTTIAPSLALHYCTYKIHSAGLYLTVGGKHNTTPKLLFPFADAGSESFCHEVMRDQEICKCKYLPKRSTNRNVFFFFFARKFFDKSIFRNT